MRLNRDGFVAMTDAMIFIVVIMVAVSVTVTYADHVSGDETDTSGFLEDILSSRVRMSDMAEGDDSLVKLSDMIALHVLTGAEGPRAYLEDAMDDFSRGRPYLLEMTYVQSDGTSMNGSIGDPEGDSASSAERTVPVTTGGHLTVSLTLFGS